MKTFRLFAFGILSFVGVFSCAHAAVILDENTPRVDPPTEGIHVRAVYLQSASVLPIPADPGHAAGRIVIGTFPGGVEQVQIQLKDSEGAHVWEKTLPWTGTIKDGGDAMMEFEEKTDLEGKFIVQADGLNAAGQRVFVGRGELEVVPVGVTEKPVDGGDVVQPEKHKETVFEDDRLFKRMILLAFVIFLVLMIVVLRWVRARNTLTILLLSFLSWGTAVANVTIEWEHPIDGWAYDPAPDTGFENFQTVHFSIVAYDSDTDVGVFGASDGSDLDSVVLSIYETNEVGDTIAHYLSINIPQSEWTITSGARLEFDLSIQDPNFPDGFWYPEITFDTTTLAAQTTEWGPGVDHYYWILTDNTPPTVEFVYTPDPQRDPVSGEPTVFANGTDGVTVSTTCDDGDGAGCMTDPIPDFTVFGNFCENDDQLNPVCDDQGARGFEVCDAVGNCTDPGTTEVEIDFYDPAAPSITNDIELVRDTGGGRATIYTDAGTLEANEEFTLEIEWEEPDEADVTTGNACGVSGTSPFEDPGSGYCEQTELPCAESIAQRGFDDGSGCALDCGAGALTSLVDDMCMPEDYCAGSDPADPDWPFSRFFLPLCLPFFAQ